MIALGIHRSNAPALADLGNPVQRNATRFDIDREALSVFAEVVGELLPDR